MGKILALDFGTKRVGCAMSDESQAVAFPREAIFYKNGDELLGKIKELCSSEKVEAFVIGVPLDSDNNETEASLKIREWGRMLEKETGLAIHYIDEFGTTDLAFSKIPFRKDRVKKTGIADSIAAQIILEKYLGN